MAIDTALKRKSAGVCRRLPGVTPNAAKPQAWRQSAARSYAGILAATVTIYKYFLIQRMV